MLRSQKVVVEISQVDFEGEDSNLDTKVDCACNLTRKKMKPIWQESRE